MCPSEYIISVYFSRHDTDTKTTKLYVISNLRTRQLTFIKPPRQDLEHTVYVPARTPRRKADKKKHSQYGQTGERVCVFVCVFVCVYVHHMCVRDRGAIALRDARNDIRPRDRSTAYNDQQLLNKVRRLP